jgi:hypothetical protein
VSGAFKLIVDETEPIVIVESASPICRVEPNGVMLFVVIDENICNPDQVFDKVRI